MPQLKKMGPEDPQSGDCRSVRIVVTGAQCTGKTTLCDGLQRALSQRGHECQVIEEAARKLADTGLPLDRESTLETYFALITAHLNHLLPAGETISIHDRFLLDSLSYVRANANAPPGFEDMLVALSHWYLKYIDYVFYLPIDLPMVADGVRNASLEYQALVDGHLRDLLTEFRVPHSVLLGNPEVRIEKAMGFLDPLLS